MGPMDNGPVKIKKINSIMICNTSSSYTQATLNGRRGWQVKEVCFFALNMKYASLHFPALVYVYILVVPCQNYNV